MKQNKKLMVAGLAAMAVAGGGLFTSAVGAQASKNGTGLADAIASKFNLKSEDVQTVIKDYRTTHKAEHEQEMHTKMTEHLDQAVTDGKITSAQKDMITAKMAETKTKMDEIRSMTDKTARKAAMDALMTDMKSWATANNIPDGLMGPGGMVGKHGGRGPRGDMGMGMGMRGDHVGSDRSDDSSAPTDAPVDDSATNTN